LSEPMAKALPQIGSSVVIVFSVDDVRAAHEELAARKVYFTQEPRNVTGNLWAANFDDPDGHHLSIFGPERKA
jgi:predicted enzyme related to lactoylglutathione lyase